VSYTGIRQKLSDARTTLPESPFLMVGEKLNVLVTDRPEDNPNKITIDVERLCAKVKMSITKTLASPHTVTIQKITLFKGANKVYLMSKPPADDITYTLTTSKNTFLPNGIVPDSPGYIVLADSFYTYATHAGKDTTKAVRFEIEAAINSPTNVRTAKFFLAEYEIAAGDTVYDIRRNYWYDIKINIKDPGMDSVYLTITACKWNLTDTIHESVGIGAKITTAVPFKLVKNITYDEIFPGSPPYPPFPYAAIQAHSKGASWIDLEVTDGTPWRLILTDPAAARNQGVIGSTDNGATWNSFPISGTGDNTKQRVYIYRPYKENNEYYLGPSFYVGLGSGYQYYKGFTIEGRDTTPIPTNCYVLRPELTGKTRAFIPLAGVFSHWENYIYNSPVTIQPGEIKARVLWKDHPAAEVVKNVSVINPFSRDSAYIYCEAGVPGNAVIAMEIDMPAPNMFWTFHIWVTAYNPYEAAGQHYYLSSGSSKNVFMDRNLGAMSNTYDTNGDARGLFYQFGRKDPFPRTADWTVSPSWLRYNSSNAYEGFTTFNLLAVPVATVFRPKLALQHTLNYPYFYLRGNANWKFEEENRYLWNSPEGNKTAYDPCPEGWRIPVYEEYPGKSPWAGSVAGFNNSMINGYYNPELGYYPKSGYMNASATLVSTSVNAYYWTSFYYSPTESAGLMLSQNVPPIYTSQLIDKAFGASVRCVVDKNYIKNAGNGGLFGAGVNNLKNVLLP